MLLLVAFVGRLSLLLVVAVDVPASFVATAACCCFFVSSFVCLLGWLAGCLCFFVCMDWFVQCFFYLFVDCCLLFLLFCCLFFIFCWCPKQLVVCVCTSICLLARLLFDLWWSFVLPFGSHLQLFFSSFLRRNDDHA